MIARPVVAAAREFAKGGAAGLQQRSFGSKSTVDVFCKCTTRLYKYRKRGTGSLVKCFHERILRDFTRGDLRCPACGTAFARPAVIKNKPANKIIGGKVFWR